MNKVTLIITSMNGTPWKIERLLESAKRFDEIIFHDDRKGFKVIIGDRRYHIPDENHYTIPEAYNLMVSKMVKTDWVCCQCDDDYFEDAGLALMLAAIRDGDADDCDVCTFRTFVTGYAPWRDKGSVLTELINRAGKFLMKYGIEVKARRWYGYKADLTPEGVAYQSNIPHGSFFRKVAWDHIGGMTGSIAHDWILWLKMIRAGIKFKYFDYIVYTYERSPNSAWFRQYRDIAHGSMKELRRIVDREATIYR